MARGAAKGGRATARRRCTASALLLVATFAGARSVRADIDLTGNWDIVGSITGAVPAPMTVAQMGTSLSVTLDTSPVANGTIDPMSGAFSVASSSPECDNVALNGVAAPDGNGMSGTATIQAMVAFPPRCASGSFGFTAVRVNCGNGVVDAGEGCDDGNRIAGDCCSPSCRIEVACALCPTAATLTKARVQVGTYDGVRGDDAFAVAGTFVSSAAAAFIDPVAHGLEIAIGIPGNPDGIDIVVPAGVYDPVTRQGWKTDRSGIGWRFHGTDPALPATRARVRLSLEGAPRVTVTASGQRRSFASELPSMPLLLGFVLDPPAATSTVCGEFTFAGFVGMPPPCALRSNGTVLSCR
jgi:cysteine-rich repeat protein